MDARVFAVQAQATYDVSKAERFGDIIYLCHDLRPLDVKDSVRRIIERLTELEYNEHKDYILMTGRLLECSFLLAVAAKISQAVRILIYDGRADNYTAQVFGVAECTAT